MSGCSFTFEGALRAAVQKEARIVLPKPNELFIDIDTAEDMAIFDEQIAIVKEHASIGTVDVAWSASGPPHAHITVSFRDRTFTPVERIAWQALLGSDRKHELLSLIAHLHGMPCPTLFFEVT